VLASSAAVVAFCWSSPVSGRCSASSPLRELLSAAATVPLLLDVILILLGGNVLYEQVACRLERGWVAPYGRLFLVPVVLHYFSLEVRLSNAHNVPRCLSLGGLLTEYKIQRGSILPAFFEALILYKY